MCDAGLCSASCWLRNNVAFYASVVAYFGLIFILSLLVFIMVMVQLARIKRQNPQNQSPNRGVLTDLRSIVGLLVLLGLSWGFALLAWGPLHSPFVYLFTICNSLQGHCMLEIQSHTLLLRSGITVRLSPSGAPQASWSLFSTVPSRRTSAGSGGAAYAAGGCGWQSTQVGSLSGSRLSGQ